MSTISNWGLNLLFSTENTRALRNIFNLYLTLDSKWWNGLPNHQIGSFPCCRWLLPSCSEHCGGWSCPCWLRKSACAVSLRWRHSFCHEGSAQNQNRSITKSHCKSTAGYLKVLPLAGESLVNWRGARQGNCQGQNYAQCKELHVLNCTKIDLLQCQLTTNKQSCELKEK